MIKIRFDVHIATVDEIPQRVEAMLIPLIGNRSYDYEPGICLPIVSLADNRALTWRVEITAHIDSTPRLMNPGGPT